MLKWSAIGSESMVRDVAVILVTVAAGCIGVLPAEEAPENTGRGNNGSASVEACRGLWDPAVKDADDHSTETVDVIIRADGPFRVGVPVPVAGPETSFASWVENASVVSEGEATLAQGPTSKGNVLFVEGDADSVLCTMSIQYPYLGNRCCAEAYLDAAWTTESSESRPDAVPILVQDGPVSVRIDYEAKSNWCGREATFGGTSLDAGWNDLPGSDGAWCE